MDNLLDFATILAREAAGLLIKYFDPAGTHASVKPDQTVVTVADLAADKLITMKIHEAFPQDEVISEESSHFLLRTHTSLWIIDPLDGTTNFSLGLPVWGVSIARLVDGYPELGVVYFPLLNELYTARRGSGAYLNSQQLSTRAPDPGQPMSFFACCSRSYRLFDINIPYKPRIFGSSAYSFCLVARGAALMALDITPKIWDLAAAWLLIEEAGGIIKPFESGRVFPIEPEIDYSVTSYPILAAAYEKLYTMGQNKIKRK